MADLVDFPISCACLEELISSFPREWQGLFAALNVQESQAIPLGTKWLHEKAFSVQEGHVSPHWSSLVRSLTLPFPVVYNKEVIFKPRFACLTLKLQRNLLSFIIVHSECVLKEDMGVFVSMMSQLNTQTVQRNPWLNGLTCVLQAKINGRCSQQNLERLMASGEESTNSPKKLTKSIPNLGISMTAIAKLNSILSTKDISFPGSNLLACNIQLASYHGDNSDNVVESLPEPTMAEEMNIDVMTAVESGSIDNEEHSIAKAEVIEIVDSPLHCDVLDFELPAPPDLLKGHEIPETADMMELEGLSEIDSCITGKVLQFKEIFKSLEEFDGEHFIEFLMFSQESSSKELEKIYQFMEMDKLPETATIALIKQFLSTNKESSFQSLVVFAEYCIGTKLQSLEQAASRNLLAAVVAFAKTHPKPFIDGVVMRLLKMELLQWPQCDLILKVIKGALEKVHLKYFLEKVLNSEKLTSSSSIWNDHFISIFAVLIDMKLEINKDIFYKYVGVLQSQSMALASNLKFAKLVLTTINKYGPMVRHSRSTFEQILEENNTFLKKSAVAALKKL